MRWRWPDVPRALTFPGFRTLFTADALSTLGDGITLVAIGFAVLDATGSLADLAGVLAARFVPLTLLLLVGGVLADRVDPRRVMVLSDLARAGSQAVFALLLATGHAGLAACVALQVVYGAAEAFFAPAAGGVLPRTVDDDSRRSANALLESTYDVSRVVGPAVGGVVVILVGAAGAIALDAATFVASAALLTRLRLAPLPARDEAGPATGWAAFRSDLREGLAEVRTRPWITVSVLNFSLFGAMTIPAVLVLGPALAWRELDGVPGWTALTSAFGLGALAGSAVAATVEFRRPGVALGLLLAFAATRPAVFVSGAGLPLVAGWCFLAGAATAVASVVWAGLLQDHVPPDRLARVSAVDGVGTSALTPVGYLVAAPLAAVAGLDLGVLLLGIVPVAASLLTLLARPVREVRAGPTVPIVLPDRETLLVTCGRTRQGDGGTAPGGTA